MLFSKSSLSLLAFVLLATDGVVARDRWLERDGRAVYLYPRRFGQEQPAVLNKLRDACPGQVCGTLAGKAVTPLLAAQPECSQQDLADEIIDASKQFDAATQANMIAIAQEYRQAEKNTPPDFSANPPRLRNSVFCQKAPKNPELNGLVQAQDPANDPNLFFDPNGAKTVQRGSQANTAPFGGAAAPAPAPAPNTGNNGGNNNNGGNQQPAQGNPAPTTPPVVTPPAAGVDFGSCQTPEIEFGPAFDGRRETSFRPVAGKGFNQGSAQNINIITRAMCDQLTNTCRANQAAKDLCAQAQQAAAGAAPAKTGIQADAFNAVFGITTNFADDTVIDDQGRIVSGGNTGGAAPAPPTNAQPATPAPAAPAAPATGNTGNTGNTGAGSNFGSCTTPQIRFAQGLDGRRETAFEPADKASFNHGSAQNIGIITQFICDTLTNSCGANQQAKDVCQQARAAAAAAQVGSGAQADAFNAVFGIQTNFVNVQQIDNQGRVVGGGAAQQPQNNNNNNNGGNTGANTGNTGANTGNTGANTGNTGANAGNNNNAGGNVQAFAGQLGGVRAPTVTANGNAFQVEGNASFNSLRSALVRSCDVQNNQCANAANASGNRNGFNVAACNAQQAQCIQQAEAQAAN